MIHRLIYVSDICEGYSDDLNRTVDGARSYFAEHDITGALWFDGNHFIQILEGPKQELKAALEERLLPTKTHCNIKVSEICPTEARTFKDWSMSYLCKGSHAHDVICARTGNTEFNPHNFVEDELADLLCALEKDRRNNARNAIH